MALRRPNHSARLRRELAVKAAEYAQAAGIPYYCSLGSPPVHLFHPFGDGRHGNFLDRSYRAICEHSRWGERLEKPHPQPGALPPDRRAGARELDSSTSSDALLMNIFCYPECRDHQPLADLFGLDAWEEPRFGVPVGVDMGGTPDRTEVDMVLGPVHVEAKLTEADFTTRELEHVRRYTGFDQLFDRDAVIQRDRDGNPLPRVDHYQLIRNILSIQEDREKRFVLLIDHRRPDLAEAWQTVVSAIRDPQVRYRCWLLTWQQVAMRVPEELQRFLRAKYGIIPAAYGFVMPGSDGLDVSRANEALQRLYPSGSTTCSARCGAPKGSPTLC